MIVRPLLEKSQHVVLMSDGATGIVLNRNGAVYISDGSEVYWIFDDLGAARLFIAEEQAKNETAEFCVYDAQYELVEFFEAKKWQA